MAQIPIYELYGMSSFLLEKFLILIHTNEMRHVKGGRVTALSS